MARAVSGARLSSSDYAAEDAAMRAAWLASQGAPDVDSVMARAGCSRGDAFRVHHVRKLACAVLVEAWLSARVLSWRQLARLALLDAPYDAERQRELARAVPSAARFLASRLGTSAKRA